MMRMMSLTVDAKDEGRINDELGAELSDEEVCLAHVLDGGFLDTQKTYRIRKKEEEKNPEDKNEELLALNES